MPPLGAAGWQLMQDTGIDRLNWTSPFLGYNIEGDLDPEKVVDDLIKNKVCCHRQRSRRVQHTRIRQPIPDSRCAA